MFGAKIYNIVCFFSLVTNPSPAASMSGCRGRQPLHICVYSLSAAKSLSLFADFTLYKKLQKRCRDLFSDTALFWVTTLYFFFYYSAPLSRIAPIEALPQAPTGLCPFLVSKVEQEIYSQVVSPLDPDQGRAPGPFARFARCFILLHSCDLFGRLCTFLTPHSSFIPALSAIHRSYLRQSFRQSIIKLIKAFQSPLPICSHC